MVLFNVAFLVSSSIFVFLILSFLLLLFRDALIFVDILYTSFPARIYVTVVLNSQVWASTTLLLTTENK
jgi:hypothetical protein